MSEAITAPTQSSAPSPHDFEPYDFDQTGTGQTKSSFKAMMDELAGQTTPAAQHVQPAQQTPAAETQPASPDGQAHAPADNTQAPPDHLGGGPGQTPPSAPAPSTARVVSSRAACVGKHIAAGAVAGADLGNRAGATAGAAAGRAVGARVGAAAGAAAGTGAEPGAGTVVGIEVGAQAGARAGAAAGRVAGEGAGIVAGGVVGGVIGGASGLAHCGTQHVSPAHAAMTGRPTSHATEDAKPASQTPKASSRGTFGTGDPVRVDQGIQDKHIEGTKTFDPTRSTLTADPQKLLDAYSGKGTPVGNASRGEVGFRERFDTHGQQVGVHRDLKTGTGSPTTRGTIHYSKTGAHVVPAAPRAAQPEDGNQ